IAEAVKGTVPLILDSGIRRGTDVVKALALGADAVAIGRPVMFGLALGGAIGVDSVIQFLHRETVDTALHCGVNRIADLDSRHVRRAAVPGGHGPLNIGAARRGAARLIEPGPYWLPGGRARKGAAASQRPAMAARSSGRAVSTSIASARSSSLSASW